MALPVFRTSSYEASTTPTLLTKTHKIQIHPKSPQVVGAEGKRPVDIEEFAIVSDIKK